MHEYFLLERHFDRMTAAAAELGDELVNAVPELPGANSAYQIVVHCCGMLEWWSRAAILGLDVDRDRDAEFEARGTVAEMLARAGAVRTQFVADLARIDPAAALKGEPSPQYRETPIGESAAGVLMHVFEELAQHHGHLELTRDLVLSGERGQ
jgi:hypothetical protein